MPHMLTDMTTMPRNEETYASPVSSPYVSSVRLRVGAIGEVAGVGQCWRLAYDRCDHVQEFAQEGLEDPARLVLFVHRNFPECLTCRVKTVARRKTSRPPVDESVLVPDLIGQLPRS